MDLEHGDLMRLLDYNPCAGVFRWSSEAPTLLPRNKITVGGIAGNRHSMGYVEIGLGQYGRHLAHRLAFFYETGRWPLRGYMIDHENGLRADNCYDNIRLASRAENLANSEGWATKKKSGLPKGVFKQGRRFRAIICVDRKLRHIGTFDTPELARAAFLAEAMLARRGFERG